MPSYLVVPVGARVLREACAHGIDVGGLCLLVDILLAEDEALNADLVIPVRNVSFDSEDVDTTSMQGGLSVTTPGNESPYKEDSSSGEEGDAEEDETDKRDAFLGREVGIHRAFPVSHRLSLCAPLSAFTILMVADRRARTLPCRWPASHK